MREIVIVISDLYLAQDSSDGLAGRSAQGEQGGAAGAAGAGGFPGIEWAARFGERAALDGGGWRPWLARWLGRGDLAGVAPGVVVAAGVTPGAPVDDVGAIGAAPVSVAVTESPNTTSWIATPVNLIAGLTNIHVDRRSILRLPADDLDEFAADFNRTFGDIGLSLTPLASGEFVLKGPATFTAATTEPARALVSDLKESLPKGGEARALKRFGAELEMWLHASPLNDVRRRRGELPVSTLWLWGGGSADLADGAAASGNTNISAAFGTDSYLAGLWRLNGEQTHALPDQLTDLLEGPQPQRAVLVVEVTPMLHLNPHWTVLEALAEIDRRFVSPAIAGLKEGALESVVLIANDTQWRVRRPDRLKLWRRRRPGISALQTPHTRPQS